MSMEHRKRILEMAKQGMPVDAVHAMLALDDRNMVDDNMLGLWVEHLFPLQGWTLKPKGNAITDAEKTNPITGKTFHISIKSCSLKSYKGRLRVPVRDMRGNREAYVFTYCYVWGLGWVKIPPKVVLRWLKSPVKQGKNKGKMRKATRKEGKFDFVLSTAEAKQYLVPLRRYT